MSFYELMERASQDVGMTFNEDKYDKFLAWLPSMERPLKVQSEVLEKTCSKTDS